jgi:hypothetical protein
MEFLKNAMKELGRICKIWLLLFLFNPLEDSKTIFWLLVFSGRL